MKTLVTKSVNDWLISRNKHLKRYFSNHQAFVDRLKEKYCSFKLAMFNVKNINPRASLELLYPFTGSRTITHPILINNKNYLTNQYHITVSLIHFAQESTFQIHKPALFEDSDILGSVLRNQRFNNHLETTEKIKKRPIIKKKLSQIKQLAVTKPNLLNMRSMDFKLSAEHKQLPLKTNWLEFIAKSDFSIAGSKSDNSFRKGLLYGKSMNGIDPIFITQKAYNLQIPESSGQLKSDLTKVKLDDKNNRAGLLKLKKAAFADTSIASTVYLSNNKPEKAVSSPLRANHVAEADDSLKGLSLFYATSNQKSDRDKVYPAMLLQRNMLVSRQSKNDFLVTVPNLPASIGFKPDFFTEMQLFYSRDEIKMTAGLAAKQSKKDEISRDFSLSQPANIQNKLGNQAFKIMELEYSHLLPRMITDTGSNTVESAVEGKEILQPITKKRAELLKKEPDSLQKANYIDLNRMVDQVYRMIEKKIQIEHERSGRWY